MERRVILEGYTDQWKNQFEHESALIKNILGENMIDVFHIGSTSIEGILSKPIIDILVVVEALSEVDIKKEVFESRGYLYRGEFGIEGRRYIKGLLEDGINHRVHFHIFKKEDPEIKKHLFFRDYLRKNSDYAKKYEQLKIDLRDTFNGDRHKYQAGKNQFCNEVLSKMEKDDE